jgi:hypothetical protein
VPPGPVRPMSLIAQPEPSQPSPRATVGIHYCSNTVARNVPSCAHWQPGNRTSGTHLDEARPKRLSPTGAGQCPQHSGLAHHRSCRDESYRKFGVSPAPQMGFLIPAPSNGPDVRAMGRKDGGTGKGGQAH